MINKQNKHKNKSGYTLSKLNNTKLYHGESKKLPRRKLTENQYNQCFEFAKNRYVEKFISFTREDLKKRYRITSEFIDRLYKDLVEYKEQFEKKVSSISVNKNVDDTDSILNQTVEKTKLLDEQLFDIRERWVGKLTEEQANSHIKDGFVYLIENPIWPKWIKVGMTLDYENRLGVYNVYDPIHSFNFFNIQYVKNRKEKEKKLLEVFKVHCEESKGEWFKIDKSKATFLFESFVLS